MENNRHSESLTPEAKIKEWYLRSYPTDDIGQELNPDITFQGLFDAMDSYQDVYAVLGVGDSLVRERVFEALAQVTGMSYDDIYDQWLKCA